MFFNLVMKNSRQNRKENGLFFLSLVVSIVAFYIILSLENQDVIIFLKTMESDAVNRLLLLIPVLYVVSLFMLFFLVYFAGKYQFERRNHEFGMYLMLGLHRGKLFFMLIAEDLWNSIVSLAVGIPAALFISEMISMITAKVVGLDIVGHNSSLSVNAVFWTIAGYILIRLTALLLLSSNIAKREVTQLLAQSQEKKHIVRNDSLTIVKLLLGIALLAVAYGLAIIGYAWTSVTIMGITVALGAGGTFLLFHGLVIVFEKILKKKKNKNGLEIFTFRQLQEHVFLKSNALAVSSLLVLMALCCLGYGISVSFHSNSKYHHVLHYTFEGDETKIQSELNHLNMNKYMNEVFDVKLGNLGSVKENYFSAKKLIQAVKKQKDSKDKGILLNHLQYFDDPYLISLTGYNNILKLAGKDSINLDQNQMALYNGIDNAYGNTSEILKNALKENAKVQIGQEEFELISQLSQDNVVTDRAISIRYGLIVPDNVLIRLADADKIQHYYNATLKEDFVKKNGLMQAIMQVNQFLDKTDLEYESYVQNRGRQLFYSVAGSYTTIYLAIIFLIIANTIMGVQFLMQQRKTERRYETIIRLGCECMDLCSSAKKQIQWFFFHPIIVALIGCIFGIRALFTGIAGSELKADIHALMIFTIPVISALAVVEFCYVTAVIRMSNKHIHGLMNMRKRDK